MLKSDVLKEKKRLKVIRKRKIRVKKHNFTKNKRNKLQRTLSNI